jgi:hypothetical protein
VYVDGVFRDVSSADVMRPDVGAAFPGYGSTHGFDLTIGSVSRGGHVICIYGLNVGPGGHALVGCRRVT